MFALAYEKTGLGRRIALTLVRALGRNTLMLGYPTTFAIFGLIFLVALLVIGVPLLP